MNNTRILPCAILLFATLSITACSSTQMNNYPPLGRSVDIGTHRMQLHCIGEGQPTILLESGATIGISNWQAIQGPLSKISRTCSYDRSGLVWSERRDEAISAEVIANELNLLLNAADETGPYVVVAASLGGIFARKYTEMFPENVSGLVLVGSSHPEQMEKMPPDFQGGVPGIMNNGLVRGTATSLLLLTGAGENMIRQSYITMPAQVTELNIAYLDHSFSTMVQEIVEVPNFLKEVSNNQDFGSLPLVVIASGRQYKPDYGLNATLDQASLAEADRISLALQKQLLSLSTNARLLVAEQSGHNINFEQPEIIIQAVTQLVNTL